jgi:outer membrane receptor protein involved in Fe transport
MAHMRSWIAIIPFILLCITSHAQQDTTKQKRRSLDETLVRGSRISEKLKESPLTIEALDIIGIRETPSANFYEGLGNLKGVDLVSPSLAFKVLNTRGFNSTSPVRSLQLIDGVDNQSPGLNFSLGNFLGACELDLQKAELVVGASSAYFGPNAFNGVISMTTRSPFNRPGLEVSVKGGERELFDGALRWAQVFKNKAGQEKFGYKLNLYYLRARDWPADNLSPTPQSHNAANNPGGYDAVNVYGDEFISGSDYSESASYFPGLGAFYRKGYHEKDIVDYHTYNVKANTAFHYRIKANTELILANAFASGTTIYRGDNPILLKDVMFFQNRLEVRHPDKWFLRAYATNEDAGKTYDAYTTALLIQQEAKSDAYWKSDYENYWTVHYGLSRAQKLSDFPPPPVGDPEAYRIWLASINNFLNTRYPDTVAAWHQAAQAYVNGVGYPANKANPFFEPGSYEFDTAFAGVTSRPISGKNGSRFIDHSALYHLQGEYQFTPAFCKIVSGANVRVFRPNSEGTIFSDTAGTTISNTEFGIYAGAEKRLKEDRLRLSLTARLDKNENFPFLFSPAASIVYQPKVEQYIRLSFSSALRNPTLQDQYLHLNVGRALLAGNIYGFNNLVTIPSLVTAYSIGQNYDSLQYFNIPAVKPEKVKTLELGYRVTIKRLYVDASLYSSWYKDFIGYKIGAQVDTYSIPTIPPIKQIRVNEIYRVATNSIDEVITMGASIGMNYYIGRYYAIVANYSWNKLDRQGSEDPLIPAFNTPEHKFNIGFNGRNVKDYGFNINYKWISDYTFEGSPQFTGPIDAFGMLDIQVNRHFRSFRTTIKLGASNVLNNEHYEVYGGPLVGRMIYLSALYSLRN